MKGRLVKVCQRHRDNRGGCLSCGIAIDFTCMRQRCHCGGKAVGYRTMGADIDIEFFCDDHWLDLPKT